ncbi:MAG: hypothetical protein ACREFH_17395, partial [Stellaceae bacterium]
MRKHLGCSVTCLMPGATETDFFERADRLGTKIASGKNDDPAAVARQAFDAMMKGQADVVTGWMNKLQSVIALITPSDRLAEKHREMAEPEAREKPADPAIVAKSSRQPVILGDG